MVTAAGRKVLQKAIFSFWERIPRRKTGELQALPLPGRPAMFFRTDPGTPDTQDTPARRICRFRRLRGTG